MVDSVADMNRFMVWRVSLQSPSLVRAVLIGKA